MTTPFSLENKTILVTGASSGIGKATAILCAQLGADVLLTGRDASRLQATFDALSGDGHKIIQADLTDAAQYQQLMDAIERLDGIVHSAGILESIPFSFTTAEKLSRIMKVNFEIPFAMTQQLVKAKKLNKAASIVFVSSLSGYSTVAGGISAYSASKGAICASVRVMALELAPRKIRVNAVCPGMVATEMNLENDSLTAEQLKADEMRNYPLGYGTPEQVASSIAFLLGDGASWITGSNLVIDGGASIH